MQFSTAAVRRTSVALLATSLIAAPLHWGAVSTDLPTRSHTGTASAQPAIHLAADSDHSVGVVASDPAPEVDEAVNQAIALSFPLHESGRKADPRAFVNRNDTVRSDRDEASGDYRQARLDAIAAGTQAGNEYLPEDKRTRYAHCSQYIGTVMLNSIDTGFPANLTKSQNEYMNDPSRGWINGWVKVGATEDYDPELYRPGDIFLTRGAGHVFMWIGEHDGQEDIVSDASLRLRESKNLRLPSLRKSPIDERTGADQRDRPYDIWRYVGDPQADLANRFSALADAIDSALSGA